MPQAAATGKHIRVWQANFLTAGSYTVVTDCAGVVAAKSEGPLWSTGPDCPYGAVWTLLRHSDLTVVKTKAHRSIASATTAGDTDHFWGNWLVDKVTKAAAEDARLPTDEREAHNAAQWRARAVLNARGAILAKWLPLSSKAKGPPTAARQQPRAVAIARHQLLWQPGAFQWACLLCHTGFRTK
jgi:hypothetical protein